MFIFKTQIYQEENFADWCLLLSLEVTFNFCYLEELFNKSSQVPVKSCSSCQNCREQLEFRENAWAHITFRRERYVIELDVLWDYKWGQACSCAPGNQGLNCHMHLSCTYHTYGCMMHKPTSCLHFLNMILKNCVSVSLVVKIF